MEADKPFVELDRGADAPDPDETPIKDRKVITQQYDLVVESLVEQIGSGIIYMRPLSERPRFQRHYVWSQELASRLIESILLNVPIPPCYLSQNDDFELDVIDGQQRLFSIYRFLDNQFKLEKLEVLKEYNDLRFFELPSRVQRQLKTHTLRCTLITNESHPEIKFDVFERLNTNTVPLNAQELRNCVYRGALNNFLGEASESQKWLSIIRKKAPDKRLRDEELILRFFAYHLLGIASYRTPQKHWLNDAAKAGRSFSADRIGELSRLWDHALSVSTILLPPDECFRRAKSAPINKALFDLTTYSAKSIKLENAPIIREEFRSRYSRLLEDAEFNDLIRRAIDHKRRTVRRFEMWGEAFSGIV